MFQLPHPVTAVRNIANFAVDLVMALGSDTVFSLTGGMAMHLNRAVGAHPRLNAVFCQHEQAVVAAAEGYAKAANFRKAGFEIPASSGYAEETFSRFFAPQRNVRFFNGAALGSMGLGLPHAIGAAYGSDRRVCCLEADGGLMLNLQELATLVHYAPKGFVIFLLNNNGYESIRASQTRFFGGVSGVDEASGVFIPRYDKISAAFGLKYLSIHTPAELAGLLDSLSPDDPPLLVDMHIDQFEYRGPAVKTLMDKNGLPSSTPLSEITW